MKAKEIHFKNKFENKFHPMNIHESGNVFDFYFFNKYFFDEIFEKEAAFFLDIKNIKTLKSYNEKLEKIIEDEKDGKLLSYPINAFKKLEDEPRRCIKSRLLGVKYVTKEEYDNYKLSESEDEEEIE